MNFTRENFLGDDIDFDIDYAKWIFDDDVVYRGSPNADNIAVGGDYNTIHAGGGNDRVYIWTGINAEIYGEAGNDFIGIKAATRNPVIYGGKGNDNLTGGDEADTFIYNSGDGKDIIYGFEEDDMLEITCKFSTPTYNAKTNVIAFKVGSTANAIQLKDFGSTTTFDINGYSYQISGSKLKKQ